MKNILVEASARVTYSTYLEVSDEDYQKLLDIEDDENMSSWLKDNGMYEILEKNGFDMDDYEDMDSLEDVEFMEVRGD
ncbi:hypothetical protein [Xenorhabdus hominickii]|uniref:Uncharacterized protein n=1 Tax=Xenorhabdus hominickii TaxID=351679 RepID=A0A2G0QBA8_XENHO|nr:hypothetical protein [Xenorhabdus hominickii]AOM40530.1 hypothetical protein A9255_07990 [Xenorhabdus hominickii]PHM56524.1 hypothetical protein Xhom_02017 [Xenorhabdus hominickii]